MIAVTVKQLSAEIIGGFMPFMWTLFKYLQMRPSSISMQVASELRSGLFANVCIQALTHRTHSCIALHNLWTTDAWLLSRNCQLSFTPQGFSDIININCYFFFSSDIPHTWGILYLLIIILKMAHSVSLKPKHVTVCQFALWENLIFMLMWLKRLFFSFFGKSKSWIEAWKWKAWKRLILMINAGYSEEKNPWCVDPVVSLCF